MQLFHVIIESLDGKVITERTGKTKCRAQTAFLPREDSSLVLMYLPEEKTESPGVSMHVYGLERMDSEYRFIDHGKRPFKLTVIKDNH
jgi:hypothetical protein